MQAAERIRGIEKFFSSNVGDYIKRKSIEDWFEKIELIPARWNARSGERIDNSLLYLPCTVVRSWRNEGVLNLPNPNTPNDQPQDAQHLDNWNYNTTRISSEVKSSPLEREIKPVMTSNLCIKERIQFKSI